MPTRSIAGPYDRPECLRVPREHVMSYPDYAPAGAILAKYRKTSWSQVGLATSNGLLELVMRHSDEPEVVNVAQLDAVAAQRLTENVAELLALELSGGFSHGAKTMVRCELGDGAWSEVEIWRLRPANTSIGEEIVTFTVRHSDNPSELNSATLPIGQVAPILRIMEALVAQARGTAAASDDAARAEPAAMIAA